jgi:hypothetical protein
MAPKLSKDEQWDAWLTDIERIYKETLYSFENRLIFREVANMMKANPVVEKDGGFFYQFLVGVYGRDQALAVRRELDGSSDAINFIRLMDQMIRRPDVITLERYKAHFPRTSVISSRMQDEQFEKLAGHSAYISRKTIGQDRKTLINACAPVVLYASKVIAHRTPAALTLTIKEIDTALDAIEKTLKKYYVLFTGGSLVTAEPTIQFNWQKIFQTAWLSGR